MAISLYNFHEGFMDKIKAAFDQRFQPWQITLPEDDLHHRRKGKIHIQGWTITYRFGNEDGKDFLEYFASHRMTNDTLNRIYEDGTTELVDACQEFYIVNDPKAKVEYHENNRRFYKRVQDAGLM